VLFPSLEKITSAAYSPEVAAAETTLSVFTLKSKIE